MKFKHVAYIGLAAIITVSAIAINLRISSLDKKIEELSSSVKELETTTQNYFKEINNKIDGYLNILEQYK